MTEYDVLKLLATERSAQCLLSEVKRTSLARSQMSAFDPKRTLPESALPRLV